MFHRKTVEASLGDDVEHDAHRHFDTQRVRVNKSYCLIFFNRSNLKLGLEGHQKEMRLIITGKKGVA